MADTAPIAGILLAAGQSRRFGDDDKRMAVLGDRPLIAYAALALAQSKAAPLYAICDDHNGPVALYLRQMGYQILVNDSGSQSASLRIGATQAFDNGASAVLIMLADMPFISEDFLDDMITAWLRSDRITPIAASDGRTLMPPVIFAISNRDRLMTLSDDSPGKSLLNGALAHIGTEEQLRDIDTQADLANANQGLLER
jgi:molybdenum cofactor cytidylyltransferase